MKMLMYGAGSIGRGFIGPLFAQAGFEVVFVDISAPIVEALNKNGRYHYTVAVQPPYDVEVKGVRGVSGLDEAAVLAEIASCDIMATSLGAAVLQRVAPLIARGLVARFQTTGKPLDILICENLKNAAELLYGWLSDALPEEEQRDLAVRCGLVEAAIGRMVPVAPQTAGDPLHLSVEEYGFLPVDKDAFVGPIPKIEALVPYSPFAFYEERKLYLHNMGHAICAYLGKLRGHEYIWQAVGDPTIRVAVQSAMTESAAMLSQRYSTPFSKIFDHAEDLLLRFSNQALGDTCERVGRDPMRKLAQGDRLAGAMGLCGEWGVKPSYIALGFAAALKEVTADAAEAWRIVTEHSKLAPGDADLVMELYAPLASGEDFSRVLQLAEQMQNRLRGKNV